MIQSAALRTNKLLLNVIQTLPSPTEPLRPEIPSSSPTPTASTGTSRHSTLGKESVNSREASSPEPYTDVPVQAPPLQRGRSALDMTRATIAEMPTPLLPSSRPQSPIPAVINSGPNLTVLQPTQSSTAAVDPFDYQATVDELTIQFLSEYEETRVAALKWLIMLHQKAPKKVRSSRTALIP
jgi:vacuole morphology and inheritance protein 14